MTVIEIPVSEFRHEGEYLIRKSADVQNVGPILGLRVSVRLDVNTDELRIAISRLELVPLLHRLGGASAPMTVVRRIDPRLVIRNVDQHVTLSFATVQFSKRSRTVCSTARKARK